MTRCLQSGRGGGSRSTLGCGPTHDECLRGGVPLPGLALAIPWLQVATMLPDGASREFPVPDVVSAPRPVWRGRALELKAQKSWAADGRRQANVFPRRQNRSGFWCRRRELNPECLSQNERPRRYRLCRRSSDLLECVCGTRLGLHGISRAKVRTNAVCTVGTKYVRTVQHTCAIFHIKTT